MPSIASRKPSSSGNDRKGTTVKAIGSESFPHDGLKQVLEFQIREKFKKIIQFRLYTIMPETASDAASDSALDS